MRNIRLRQLLPLNREKGISTGAIKCQQTYTTHSLNSTNPAAATTAAATHDYAPTVVGLPHSVPNSSVTKVAAFSQPTTETSTALLSTKKEPILLLEGDNYRFSASGIARSLYQLVPESNISQNTSTSSSDGYPFPRFATNSLTIEEIYDIGRARKGFVIRDARNGIRGITERERRIKFGEMIPPISLLLQEISPKDEQNGAGTGSRTWESSIAMSAFFASHPDLMFGNVIEIGSGVGLGGILSFLFRSLSSSTVPFHSMTLSDCKAQVLDHCNENVKSFLKSHPFYSSISVAELDWYDIFERTRSASKHTEKYDTVIACDCAYDYTDVAALVGTLKGLLRPKKTSKAHIFGPTSRGGLRKLLSELKQEECFDVHLEYIEMARYRLDPPRTKDSLQSLDDLRAIISSSETIDNINRYDFHSKFESEFLHVTCSLRMDSDVAVCKDAPLRDID